MESMNELIAEGDDWEMELMEEHAAAALDESTPRGKSPAHNHAAVSTLTSWCAARRLPRMGRRPWRRARRATRGGTAMKKLRIVILRFGTS
jgi:hypothetical protein